MNLELRSILEKGVHSKERITLRALASCDAGDFALLQTGVSGGTVTIGVTHTYWFPYTAVEKGDLIILYTKTGKQNSKVLESGKTAHFFYWGIDRSIWDADVSATLLYSPEWQGKLASEL